MIYTKPDYYDDFNCIADKCPDTCCAGWQIVIDEEALEKYEAEPSEYRKILEESIDWREGVFKQKNGKRCAFLNENNLCEMYLQLGEDSLCDTCTRYPRHIEEFENIREYTLSVSCPEVARILLNKKEPVSFSYTEDTEEEEFEEYDPFLFSILEDGREVIREILQNRSLDISTRAAIIWELSDKMQECIDEGKLFACEDIFECYKKGELPQNAKNNTEQCYAFAYKIFRNLYQLERLSEDWDFYLAETEAILYQNGVQHYQRMRKEFAEWLKAAAQETKDIPDWSIMAEQLLVYFIYTYFCGAVYDYAPAVKVRMSVISVHYIYELLMARWQKNGNLLDMEDIIFIVYRYSRELEHSDENLELMEEMMEQL